MSYHRSSSPITKVFWAGWESDTLRLQQQGWQFSAEQDIYRLAVRIAIKHPNFKIYGISDYINFSEYLGNFDNGTPISPSIWRQLPSLLIRYMASRININLMENSMDFKAVDMLPNYEMKQIKSLEDFEIFRPIGNTKEIIVTPDSVPELLELIMKRQDPKQAEIREKKRKEWRKFTREINKCEILNVEHEVDPRNNIVAQLITL